MVHHSIAVVITSFLPNFSERRLCELRRITLPRTQVNSVGYAQGFEGKELSRCLQ